MIERFSSALDASRRKLLQALGRQGEALLSMRLAKNEAEGSNKMMGELLERQRGRALADQSARLSCQANRLVESAGGDTPLLARW